MTLAADKTVAPAPTPVPGSAALPGFVQVSIVGIFLILVIGAMYYARSFFLPLVLALRVRLIFAPLVHTLARRGIPAALAQRRCAPCLAMIANAED